ncbi:hypothetical protein G7K_0378-t1 [Saitoella complicata NRRL Y-17804]|uniref:AP-2 complex subunit alpha n=2 Tax=Saitoella complicata (strain BCRC 22490 / CBS 7301 / JCM 7358 / NBRC 10748 / NRRL Y-17804) TaxID=698492 RepID=A0A0E9N8I8_SAICN|nr:hypothetical protein G7K_0378-t1 [Saitoella complicata NRRL Y-17804]
MSSMRGLVVFISDLRNARVRELEEKRINKELANIRSKFKEAKLDGYQRKKYVCKLLYIYILGWDVSFGHLEAVTLVSSSKYSEKQIGYLAVTLMLHENHELLHLVINSIKKDLDVNSELFNCLALHAIANVGSKEMAEVLSPDVHRLLISPTSKPFVKKKAALTLLRLYRKYPGIIQPSWVERIIAIMDDPDLGVTLSVSSLVLALVQDSPELWQASLVKAAGRLYRLVVKREYSEEYLYYNVPIPWLQVKLLRLLQYYPPSDDPTVQKLIGKSLQRILDTASEPQKNVQQNNAQNAILFEAINLSIHLSSAPSSQEYLAQCTALLGKFISSRETNVRYLGLETMTHLASTLEDLRPLQKHQATIIQSLRDRDISVRRRGLDLLYSMCDSSNAQVVVAELLRYLQSADYSIREEMVLKIAILTEKFATDATWYIDITLQLLSFAGDYVSDEVWERVVQIVTNNEELQEYAAMTVLQHLKSPACHESLVRVGGYILGEYGHLIANTPGSAPIDQFNAVHSKFAVCSPGTRAMLLSTYVKFINLFPEIKHVCMKVFNTYSKSIDAELQQRACEYLALVSMPTDDLMQTVLEEMPPFPERQSALLKRLHGKTGETEDKRIWVLGGKDASNEKEALKLNLSGVQKRTEANGNATSPGQELVMSGLDMNSPVNLAAPLFPNLASAAHLSPGWEEGYYSLLSRNEGVLYEDEQIQIGWRSEFHGPLGRVALYFGNKTTATYQSLTSTVENPDKSALSITSPHLPSTTLPAEGQTQQMLNVECLGVFREAPTIRISYLAGALQAVTLKLPVTLNKFIEPAQLGADDFFPRWKQIGGGEREAQKIFSPVSGERIDLARNRRLVEGLRWAVLDGVDQNPKNIVGAGVLHSKTGKIGVLMRLEPNMDQNLFRCTIRATNEAVPKTLKDVVLDAMKAY